MEKDAKPAPAPVQLFVTSVVKDAEGRRLTRTMRSTDELQVLMDFYYAMVPPAVGVFMYRRMPIRGSLTPADYDMEDGAEIDFFREITPGMFVTPVLVTPVLQDFRGRSFTRTMRRASRMQDLMDFYRAMVPAVGGGLFLYRGERVTGEQTPAGLELQDRDRIYFVPGRRGEVVEEEMKKPVITPGGHVTLKVLDTEGRTVHCTMRRTERVRVLMKFYCATVRAEDDGYFFFDGRRLHGEMTPAELEMEDGDEVHHFALLYG